ncbi:MAG: hypothetical protein H6592_15095 [Flavobacteriales bacterium]|nr:hypothetical protein [Flavobacteriales bacterium]
MKKLILKLLLVVGLLALLAVILDPLFTWIHRHGNGTKAQWLHRMHDERYDAVVIGSSRALWNIDMNAVNAACGMRTISLANNHFRPAEILLTMRVFLRNGNTTKRLLLQVDSSMLTDEQEGFSSTLYDFVPFLEDDLIYDFLLARDPEWYWLRHIPFWRYTKYNFKWGLEPTLRSLLGRRPVPFDSTGSYFSPNDRFYGTYDYTFVPVTEPNVGEDLRALFALCRANGIEPVVFTSPNFLVASPEHIRNATARLMAGEGLDLYDFTDSLNAEVNFNDNRHLNRTGGRRFTQLLIEQVICP